MYGRPVWLLEMTESLSVYGLRKKCLHFLDLCIIILCKAMKEKSSYREVLRECPVGARTWRKCYEYVPEPLPERGEPK